jgi:hypothetical protein
MWVFILDYLFGRMFKRRLEKWLSEWQSMKQEIRELENRLSDQQADLYQRYAGSNLKIMLRERKSAEQFLNHEDPRLRFVSLAIILNHWGVTEAVVDHCILLAPRDCDVDVRQVALLCIGRYYQDTQQPSICGLLAKIAADEGTNADVREVAYDQLCRVAGIPWHRRKFIGVTFPENIDWALLKKYGKG